MTACSLARLGGQLAYRYFTAWHGGGADPAGSLPVEWKDGDEPVTVADRAVNTLLVDSLHRSFAADAILSEELPDDGTRRQATRTWLVDPIDGTKDFIAGRGGYSVMIGLLVDAQPVLGVVYQPTVDRLFYASQGHGAWLVEGGAAPRRLAVSAVSELGAARMVSSASIREPMVDELRSQAGIKREVQIGSVGIKLGLIAAAECDLYVNPAGKTKLWDSGPPSIILHEAGGRLTDLHGRPLDYRGELNNSDGLVASNGILHAAALARLAPLAAARSAAVGR